MVLEWFAGARDESIDDLVRRKRFGKAVKLLRAELEKRKGDRRLRLRLGEILVLAGEREEGLRILSRTADDLALRGQVAQAIAVLKKIEAIDPGREDVEDKMAYLVERRARPAWDPWSGKGKAARATQGPEGAGEGAGALEIGFEPSERLEEARAEATPPGALPEHEGAAAAAPPSAADALPLEAGDDAPLSEDAMRNEILALIEDTLQPSEAPPAGPAAAPVEAPAAPDTSLIDTPLFRNFARDELAALIRGLRLLAFQPGEIVVSEGERGASLFLLVSGSVRAYVRNAGQHQVQVRELKEGDFFGEISVLTGQPRSATVVAAARCELLELDKPTLDRIAGTHPHVREVLQEFYDQRADNTLETMIRSMGLT